MTYCKECFIKQQKINELEAEVASLKDKLRYAHLLRTVRDLEKDFPENAEIKSFVEALAPQLANAISLRTLDITDQQFKRQAAKIKSTIINIICN